MCDLLAQFKNVRAASDALAAPLSAEDCTIQSMPDASPVKWHLAHTSWFFETIVLGALGIPPFDPSYAYLFNSYYEALGPRHPRPHRGLLTRPSLDAVKAYRRHVDAQMEKILPSLTDEALKAQVVLGLHHEQQHQELILTDIKHALFANPLRPAYCSTAPRPETRQTQLLEWEEHPGGLVEIGHQGDMFAFDNERPRHAVMLQPFRMANRTISNSEYLAFMEDGGYQRPEFWLSDGWARVQEEHWDAPLYWFNASGQRNIFTLAGVEPLDGAAPLLHVSFYEAAAYAAWAQKRLPTEFEWEAINAGRALPGVAWEWTRSSYDPYPGFRPFQGAASEYNGKFMIGQMVLRGGSFATPANHIRSTYRNFFPPQARWQFSGIRLAQDA